MGINLPDCLIHWLTIIPITFRLTEASYVMVRLLQRFDRIEARKEELEGPIESALSLTSCPGRPVTLKLHEARE